MPHGGHYDPHAHWLGRPRGGRGAADDPDRTPAPRDHGPGHPASEPGHGQQPQGHRQASIPADDPPERRPGHPRMPAGHEGSEFNGPRHEAEGRIAARAARRRQRHRDASRQHAREPQSHRQRHERRDHDVEQDPDRAHHMKPRGHHRRRYRPHGGTDEEQIPGLATESSQQPLGRTPAAVDEPRNRIGRGPRPHDHRHRAHENRRGEKRELCAGADDVSRTECQDRDCGGRQRVDGGRTPFPQSAETGEPDE